MKALDVRAIEERGLAERPFPKVKQEFRILVAEEAFDRAVARGDGDTTHEVGGVLVGQVLRDAAGPYVAVEATIDALHADEKGAELTFTQATWEHINAEMDGKHEGKKIVGWYHSHPGFGVFLSDRDQFIHRSFFDQPFQIALVYDPKSKEHGVFAWREGEAARVRRWWVGQREHGWDGARAAAAPAAREEKAGGAAGERPRPASGGAAAGGRAPAGEGEGVGSDWLGLALWGLLLAIVGGFGGYWLGGRAAAGVVQQAEVQILQAKQEGQAAALAALDGELAQILREALGDDAIRKPSAAALAALDEGVAALEAIPAGDPKLAEAAGKLREARDRVKRMADDHAQAEAVLRQIEAASRRRSSGETARELAEQRSAIGQLYAELALDTAKGGDGKRARRLLGTAARVDPGNAKRYEQLLQQVDPGAKLEPAAPGAGEKK